VPSDQCPQGQRKGCEMLMPNESYNTLHKSMQLGVAYGILYAMELFEFEGNLKEGRKASLRLFKLRVKDFDLKLSEETLAEILRKEER